ncbi:MAG: PocR ligand-binding domain-containing protein, partial [Clostridia bacterium]|nr:PocR ligand-binding domain-containing protein [Clostridia bacterium]
MNLPMLEKMLSNFYQISGLEIAIIDTKYRQILSHRHAGKHFCITIHTSPDCVELCRASDLAQMQQAGKIGELITYTCPFGIFAAIVPVFRQGEVIGYLTFAMALEEGESKSEFPVRKALSLAPTLDPVYLQACADELPKYSRERLEAYATLL